MPTVDYKEFLHKELSDSEFASGYLTECLALGMDEFLLGLKNVVDANGGIGGLAKDTSLNRESLYKLLSERGNPRLSSLGAILDALGMKLQFSPKDDKEKEAAQNFAEKLL